MNTFMSPKRARSVVDEFQHQLEEWEAEATSGLSKPDKTDYIIDASDLLREFAGLSLRSFSDRNQYGLPVGELFGFDIPEYSPTGGVLAHHPASVDCDW